MAEPLGFEYYRDNYTTEQLWDMLITQGDPMSVELSSTVWATARGKLLNAREALNANVSDLATYWQGPASEEFQNRMVLVVQYSEATEFLMTQAETNYLPNIAGYLASAQARARGENALGEDLDPANDITDLEEWMEQVKGLSRPEIAALTSSGWNTNANEHTVWREARHDELAQTVADLGAQYAEYTNAVFAEPHQTAPDGMPGSATFERPTGGVFADNPIEAPADATTQTSTRATQPDTSANNEAFASVLDDEDDEAPPWTYSSHDDFDEASGGLAGGSTATALPTGGSPIGGTSIGSGTTAAGSGFPSAASGGAGVVPGRGLNSANPTSGAVPSNGRSTAAGRGGVNPNLQARPAAGRDSGNTPVSGRRRSDETEEEETEARESKYVEAENVFSVPFDPAAGPAHEGPKYQRAWDKEHATWEERRREEEE
ncbi:hypothetical protein [Glycomyces arizonensis]|uniref:hypothetical protein n=1 Tax=Glycomyces arizonensis TaxID=256035 RepID=UPI0003F82728|nr:hypothetical protein [Glycomyces arizonensis]